MSGVEMMRKKLLSETSENSCLIVLQGKVEGRQLIVPAGLPSAPWQARGLWVKVPLTLVDPQLCLQSQPMTLKRQNMTYLLVFSCLCIFRVQMSSLSPLGLAQETHAI